MKDFTFREGQYCNIKEFNYWGSVNTAASSKHLIHQAHDVVLTSMWRVDVASTSVVVISRSRARWVRDYQNMAAEEKVLG